MSKCMYYKCMQQSSHSEVQIVCGLGVRVLLFSVLPPPPPRHEPAAAARARCQLMQSPGKRYTE
jgi:hypothetical protein